MKRDALAWLVAPLDPAEFVEHSWMQRSIHIPGTADKVGALFSLDAFHAAVAAAVARPDAARHGFGIRAGAERPIPATAIDRELAAGATICVSAIELGHPALAALAAELKLQLGFPGRVAVNAYLSPRGSGFSFTHFDARIATTLQIAGRKRWRYAATSSLPWPAHNVRIAPGGGLEWHQPPAAWETAAGLPGPLAAPGSMTEVVLAPGDVLCLPAGTFHAAEAVDDLSLSINFNFSFAGGFFGVLMSYLAARLLPDAGWRSPPPAPTAAELEAGVFPPAVAEFLSARLAELRQAIDRVEPRAGLDAALMWHASLHAPPVAALPALPALPARGVERTDTLEVVPVSLLRDEATGRAYLVSVLGALPITSDAVLPFARRLVGERRFVAGDALAWTDPAYRWEELRPVLDTLVRGRVLGVVTP